MKPQKTTVSRSPLEALGISPLNTDTTFNLSAHTPSSKVKDNTHTHRIIDGFYDAERRDYYFKNERGVWLALTESQFKKHLKAAGFSTKTVPGEMESRADSVIRHMQNHRDIQYAGRLCGAKEGFHEVGAIRFLVTESYHLPEPVKGKWDCLEKIILGLLRKSESVEVGQKQWDTLHGWMQTAQIALRAGRIQQAQMMALAGPAGCGKSLFQSIITETLGGRVAKAARYMQGGTDFNGDLFEAEHLALEDEFMSHRISDRLQLGASIKNFCVSTRKQSCHRKNRQAVTLPAWWRVSITLNDDPEAMRVLPPLDDHIQDKIILLRGSRFEFPMPMDDTDAQDRLFQQIKSEIPAYLYWLLNEFQIPPSCADSRRYIVATWHHPELKQELENLSPEADLLALVDAVLWQTGDHQWRGTAEELQAELIRDSTTSQAAKKLLEWRQAAGTYLQRLVSKHPERVEDKRTSTKREYLIRCPSEI